MAHQCPDCWTICYCGGDIDDICFEGSEEEMHCTHCFGKEDEEEWGDFDDNESEETNP